LRRLARIAATAALAVACLPPHPAAWSDAATAAPAPAADTSLPPAPSTPTTDTLSPSAKPADAPSSDTDPDPTLEWSVAPADENGPDGRISLRHTIDPGSSVTDAIAVTNLGDAATAFTIAVGGGVVGADGVFDIAEEAGDAGDWITVNGAEGSTVTVQAGDTEVLPVTVSVPAGALPGDHPAGIAVGVTAGNEVTVRHRVGVRVHLRVSGAVDPDLTVQAIRTRFSPSPIPFWPGTLRVDYEVRNTGNVRLGASGIARAHGPFGWAPVSRSVDLVRELLPGEAAPVSVTMPASPVFRLTGGLDVTPRAVGEDGIAPPPPVAAAFALTAISWSGFAAVGAIVVASWWVLRRRIRTGRGHGAKPSPSMRRECDADNSA
jgi:hypothetical protein